MILTPLAPDNIFLTFSLFGTVWDGCDDVVKIPVDQPGVKRSDLQPMIVFTTFKVTEIPFVPPFGCSLHCKLSWLNVLSCCHVIGSLLAISVNKQSITLYVLKWPGEFKVVHSGLLGAERKPYSTTQQDFRGKMQ